MRGEVCSGVEVPVEARLICNKFFRSGQLIIPLFFDNVEARDLGRVLVEVQGPRLGSGTWVGSWDGLGHGSGPGTWIRSRDLGLVLVVCRDLVRVQGPGSGPGTWVGSWDGCRVQGDAGEGVLQGWTLREVQKINT